MGAELTPQVADSLYTGLATDTGCFRFSNTTAATHRTAARLIEAGARIEELNTILFATRSRGQMEAERIARSHLEYHLDGRCALIWLDRDETEASGAAPARCLMVGGTDHDAETARAMGVRCILYAGGHQTRPRLEATGCTVIDRLADLPGLL